MGWAPQRSVHPPRTSLGQRRRHSMSPSQTERRRRSPRQAQSRSTRSSPSGAVVVYPAFSVDDNCPGVKVSSSPKPGSTFAIGDTRVTGTATDASGNTTTASFIVHVNGAAAQLTQLSTSVVGVGPGTLLFDTVDVARRQLAKGNKTGACVALDVFIPLTRVQIGKRIPTGVVDRLIADAQRIRAVIRLSILRDGDPTCTGPVPRTLDEERARPSMVDPLRIRRSWVQVPPSALTQPLDRQGSVTPLTRPRS